MTTNTMVTHTIGVNTFAIFEKEQKGGVWMVHFLWGKKDFRIYLGRKIDGAHQNYDGPILFSPEKEVVTVTKLQYLNSFEWYDFLKVAGHGLANEEVCWTLGKQRRYVELPKGFFDIAVALACLEFGLERQPQQVAV